MTDRLKRVLALRLARGVGVYQDGGRLFIAEASLSALGKRVHRVVTLPAGPQAVAEYFGTDYVPVERPVDEAVAAVAGAPAAEAKSAVVSERPAYQVLFRARTVKLVYVAPARPDIPMVPLKPPAEPGRKVPPKIARLVVFAREWLAKRIKAAQPSDTDAAPVERKPKTKWLDPIVATAISPHSLFFGAGPFQREGGKHVKLDDIISENPRFAFLSSSELHCSWMTRKIKDRTFVLLAGVKRRVLTEAFDICLAAGRSPRYVEPAPWAALRVSWMRKGARSPFLPEVRILVGSEESLVAFTVGNYPLLWECVPGNGPEHKAKILNTAQALCTFARKKLRMMEQPRIVVQHDQPLDWILPDLEEMTEKGVVAINGPPFDGQMVASGLALVALNPQERTIDFRGFFKDVLPIKHLFPRRKAVISLVLMVACLGYLVHRMNSLAADLANLKQDNDRSAWSTRSTEEELLVEQDKAESETTPMAGYLTDRLWWTPLVERTLKLLPDNAWLLGLEGADLIWEKSGSGNSGERWMLMRLAAAFPPGGATPHEIDDTLRQYRADPEFKRIIPKVELSSISFRKEGKQEQAVFSILALPKEIKVTKHSKKGGKDEKKGKDK